MLSLVIDRHESHIDEISSNVQLGEFFVGGLFAVPFVTLPWLLRSRRVRFVILQLLFCLAGLAAIGIIVLLTHH